MAIWARDHSVPTPNKIYTEDLIQRRRTLVKLPLGIRPYVTVQFQISILELGFEIIKNIRMQRWTSRDAQTSRFAVCESQNPERNPNGIPLLCNTFVILDVLILDIWDVAIAASYLLLHYTNLEVSLALVFHLAPRGFPSEVHLSFTSL